MKRRDFLLGSAAAAAVASFKKNAAAQSATVPTVIATWDYGLELVTAAQKALAADKDLLDALEAGVNVVENDPKVMTVGYGGLPQQDGNVQLHAAMMDRRPPPARSGPALVRHQEPLSGARQEMERPEHRLP